MPKDIKTIDLLYFDDCPSWIIALGYLQETLKDVGIDCEINLIKIETNEEALKNKFPGSPTIKVNGSDIFPTNHKNYALGCRVYQTPQGFRGSPSKEMITDCLNQISSVTKE
ncbi:MAG: DUF2703 domain-containing protein [Desulfobacterales bacterium]|nr:DUF2703 domain-containing protein [Desulfobacterales bacterium]